MDEAVAMESQTIKHMIENDCADNGIPLPNVSSKIFSKVIEYFKKHVDASFNSSAMKNFDGISLGKRGIVVAYVPRRHQGTIPRHRRSPFARADLSAYLYFFIMNF